MTSEDALMHVFWASDIPMLDYFGMQSALDTIEHERKLDLEVEQLLDWQRPQLSEMPPDEIPAELIHEWDSYSPEEVHCG